MSPSGARLGLRVRVRVGVGVRVRVGVRIRIRVRVRVRFPGGGYVAKVLAHFRFNVGTRALNN